MAKLRTAQALSLIIALATGVIGIWLLGVTIWYWSHGAASPIGPTEIQQIIYVEFVGLALTYALGKGKPTLRMLFGNKKQRVD